MFHRRTFSFRLVPRRAIPRATWVLACILGGLFLNAAAAQTVAGTAKSEVAKSETAAQIAFPRPVGSYGDGQLAGIAGKLASRARSEPFNAAATLIFACAVAHTLLVSRFSLLSRRYQAEFDAAAEHESHPEHGTAHAARRDELQFRAQFFHFMGEVEAVFGIWLVPLALAIVLFHGWDTMIHYFAGANVAEPVFVVVVMAMASSKPVLRLAETCMARLARLGRSRPAAWWLSILIAGPMLGSLITEPAAMTICALLLGERFYALNPGMSLRYATLGLLFVNISTGGTLSHFAAPPVVMVAQTWKWGFAYMFTHFGWKATAGIAASSALYYLCFRREFASLSRAEPAVRTPAPRRVPVWITLIHLLFITWTVLNAHYPVLVVLGFLFFLAFTEATERHQNDASLRGPLLVGFFLAALVIHGGCQQWWIAPVLEHLSRWPLMLGATALTAVNDNAAITYLASLVPNFAEPLRYAVMAGAVAGGGLTVIANAPNPAGQSVLRVHFGESGISPVKLFLAAIIPTLIVGAAFMLLP